MYGIQLLKHLRKEIQDDDMKKLTMTATLVSQNLGMVTSRVTCPSGTSCKSVHKLNLYRELN